MCRSIVAAALSALALMTAAEAASAASVVYREVFPLSSPTADLSGLGDEQELNRQGWHGGNAGDGFVRATPEGGEGGLGGGAGAGETTPVASNPIGDTNATRFGFFSQTTISNAFLYTNEFQIESADLRHMSWDSRHVARTGIVDSVPPVASGSLAPDGAWFRQGSVEGANVHLAFRVGTSWYVSLLGYLHPADQNTWAFNNVDLLASDLDWVLFDNFGAGPTNGSVLPSLFTDTGDANTGVPLASKLVDKLPAGTVTAFGFYSARSFGTFRVDNVALSAEVAPIPLPAAAPMLLGALAGLGALGLRRRRLTA